MNIAPAGVRVTGHPTDIELAALFAVIAQRLDARRPPDVAVHTVPAVHAVPENVPPPTALVRPRWRGDRRRPTIPLTRSPRSEPTER